MELRWRKEEETCGGGGGFLCARETRAGEGGVARDGRRCDVGRRAAVTGG